MKNFELVNQLKCLEAVLTNHEEIEGRLKSGNACYHSVQQHLSSILMYKD